MAREKLSAVIIALNEENCMSDCLQSLQFCDEIVVVDSGSTDATPEICRQYGAKVIQQEWLGFGPQKQFAVGQAAYDWVLCVDADEKVSETLGNSILAVMDSPQYGAYQMPRCNRFLGRMLRHGEGYPDLNLRLFNRKQAQWSDDAVHEKVETTTEVGLLTGDIIHDSAETLDKYLAIQNRYTTIQAKQLIASSKKIGITKLFTSSAFRFIKFYFLKLGFLDGVPGLVHIMIGCMNSFIKYAKLYEHQCRQ